MHALIQSRLAEIEALCVELGVRRHGLFAGEGLEKTVAFQCIER